MSKTIGTILTTTAALLLGGSLAPAAAQHGVADPELFVTAGTCMACHNGLVSPQGMDISIGTNWRGSMMANAARDPYWQAAVKRETLDHPEAAVAIQDECSKCHMPMARFEAHAAGRELAFFGDLPWQAGQGMDTRAKALAADGVSCTACHQIEPEGLGEEATFTGGFRIDTTASMGQRRVYGSYDVPVGSDRAMLSSGRFQPTQSEHIRDSGLCASCHTLYTHARNDDGEVIGELPEQVPYLEWLHSDYRDEQSCQSCHMPGVEGETAISSVLPNPRPDVRQHVFRGGNIFVPRILNLFRADLAVAALPAELDGTVKATERFLTTATARVAVPSFELDGGRLAFDVEVTNLAGHKLPTAYPSRRAWLHVTVTDADGRVVFESGAPRPDGSIAGNDNDRDAQAYEPHHRTITEPDQVQIYEPIMVDYGGAVTTGLVYGVGYVKDNRLLPRGFDRATAEADIAVRGDAAADPDFRAPDDRVRYEVDVPGVPRPLRVDVELRYQPIGYRWARNLAEYDAAETNRFVGYYEALSDVSSIALAATTRQVE
ncbi:MAG: hypothetical protein ACOCUW_05085 [Gemmatimonadota bacterium]